MQCVISSTHIVFLLTNGRICRYKYTVKTEASTGSASKFTSTAELEGRSSKSQKKDSDSWDAAPDNILPSMRSDLQLPVLNTLQIPANSVDHLSQIFLQCHASSHAALTVYFN